MNNEISSKSSLSLSSVDATLAAIIPDTPIVSIAGSTLSEITTTTTSTTTTPTPTPTSYETNKVDNSPLSSVAGLSIPSMSGVSPKIAGAATNRATASSISTSNTNSIISSDDSATNSATTVTADVACSNDTANIDASNSNQENIINPPITATNTIDTVTAGATNTGATTKSPTIIVASPAGNTKSEPNATDKKSKDTELWEEEKFTNLDDQNLKLLLEEAYSYRSPTDKENKSELFLSLLEKAENEKEDITLCRMPTSSRLKRISYTTHNHHQQHHHHRHKQGGSLQDLDEAVRNETIIDPDDFFSSSCGQRNRRNNHNSRQKKYSTTVSSRQREGGSLPNNVNFTNCARLFGFGGNGGGIAGSDVAGIAPVDQQFPFMHEINTVNSNTVGGTTVVVAAAAGSACGSNNNSGNNNNNNSSSSSSGTSSNNSKQPRRNATRTNAMSSTSLATTPSTASAAKIEAEELVGQPIGVLIGGQVITPKSSASIASSNGSNKSNDTANGSILSTGCRTLKDAICSVNVGDCVIEMGETIIDVQQQQKILQSKSQEAISQGRVYYDRLDNVELMPRSNMMSAVPSRTCFGPTTANAYVDEKVHFTALRNYNPSAIAASGGSKTNQVGGVDTKYLPLGDDYKAYKSVLAIADKEDMREVDENGNAVTETFSVNTTNTHAATATVYNSINVTSAPVIASASTNSGGSTQTTKSKSKKQPKQERNVTTVNVQAVAGYRGTDPVEKLVEYIESTTGDDNKNKQKKERKKQEKQDKHNKIKKSNSLEELRSCAKMEVDELKRTAATTESNVMMRNKGKGGKNNSSSTADIDKNFDSNSSSNATTVIKDKSSNVGSSATVVAPNRKGERRSWGTEELQYLGDANGNKNANSSSSISVGVNSISTAANHNATDEKVKEKERKIKNRESQKDRIEDRDKCRLEKVEKVSVDVASMPTTTHNSIAAPANVKPNGDKNEKQHQQVEKPEKAEKRKKGETQQALSQQQAKPSVSVSAEPIAVVDILAMESLLPETAEFHVVTKKKKTKKQRSSPEESNGTSNNNNKTHNFIASNTNLKPSANQQHQSTRFNAKFNSNEHSNNNTNNGNNNNNHYQQHHSNNHYHNQQQQQQIQSQQQQHQQQNNDKSRRKSTSSVPPSEKSDSSDLDSVHSLPIERAAKLAGSTSNPNASKTSNKQMRQNKNTAGSVATMSLPQKAQQVQQMPTPFSYAEIAKEAKSLNAIITTPLVNNVNNSNNNNGAEQATQTHAVADSNNSISQQHPPTMTTEEVKTTPLRGQQSQQQLATGTTNNSSSTMSSTTSSTTTAPTATATASNTHSSNQNSNPNANKTNKMKKSNAKTDFPALGSASEVAVAASAARADIFAKAVLNSSQQMTVVQQHQQHNPNARDTSDNATVVVTTPKSTIVSQIDVAPKDATPQQQLQVQSQQNPGQQPQQHQQTLQKSKSVEHETSIGISSSSNSNISYSNTMDHQQYPALKTVKRHSAFNFTTLPPTATTSVASTAGLTIQQHHANNQNATQFNFAAAARQMATNVPAIANSSNEISTAVASETTTSTTETTGTTTTAAVSKKNPGAAKEKTLQATSITNVTPSATNEQNPKRNKKEKQHHHVNEATSKTSTTTVALSRKSTAATQTNTAHLGHNEGTGKQSAGTKLVRGSGSTTSTGNTNTAMPLSTAATTGVATVPQQVVNQTVTSTNRPAVIILNDDTAGISTDFTFGDFNEDELHFFDDETEDYAPTGASASGTSDELIEEHPMPKLTSSSPRSGSILTTSLQQLNDSGSSTDLCTINNNTSGIQQGISPQTDDIMNSSDGTLSPNNSTLTAIDNQHSSSVGLGGGNSNSSRSIASGSNHSGDSGIYTSASKIQEKPTVDTSNVNTFLQQHLAMANTNPTTNELENSSAETTECNIGNMHQPRQQQLETCNEIESAIIAAARRAANQQQQYAQQKPAPTANVHYQHSNSNSSSFSSSSSVDGGVNRYYSAAQSPPPPSHVQQQQQPQAHYYNNNRQAYAPYPVHHHTQHLQQQQLYHQNYNMLPASQPQPMMVNTNVVTPANMYSRSNSDCDEDFVSPPPGTYVVKIQNKEYDLQYLPPNMSTNGSSQNEIIVEYVSSVWDEVITSKYTRIYDGQ